jgi:hypothetical protein
MRPAEYWDSSLPEIADYLEGSRLAQRDAMKAMKASAWWNAALAGQEKLSDLAALLSDDKKPKRGRSRSLEALKAEWEEFFGRVRASA